VTNLCGRAARSMFTGRPHQATGNSGRRWMITESSPRGGEEQNPAYRPARPPTPLDSYSESKRGLDLVSEVLAVPKSFCVLFVGISWAKKRGPVGKVWAGFHAATPAATTPFG